jgi:hypothetical protein
MYVVHCATCAAIHFGQSQQQVPTQPHPSPPESAAQLATNAPTTSSSSQLPSATSTGSPPPQEQQQQQQQASSNYPVTPMAMARTDVSVIPTVSGNELVRVCVVCLYMCVCVFLCMCSCVHELWKPIHGFAMDAFVHNIQAGCISNMSWSVDKCKLLSLCAGCGQASATRRAHGCACCCHFH